MCSGRSDDSPEGAGIHGPIIAPAHGFDGLQATGAVTEAARGPVCVSPAVLPGVHQARRATNAPVALAATAQSAAASLPEAAGCRSPVGALLVRLTAWCGPGASLVGAAGAYQGNEPSQQHKQHRQVVGHIGSDVWPGAGEHKP